jgi:hypothetical protein
MLQYAETLEPKCKPTAVKRKDGYGAPAFQAVPRVNPLPAGADPLAPETDLAPVPVYKAPVSSLKSTPAFEQLEALFQERIAFIDGAMGTMIQRHKLQEEDFRGDRWAAGLGAGLGWAGLGWAGLGWAGLGWAGLGWAGLGCIGLGSCGCWCCCAGWLGPAQLGAAERAVVQVSGALG